MNESDLKMDERIKLIRDKIDRIDEKIIELLKTRMLTAREMGSLKKELNIPVEDQHREKEIIDRLTRSAGGTLSEEQLIRIFEAVFHSAKQVQK
ncbi:MAG: chorismate mutase [Candidatus Marinimicrobia bacterium]|nr:chorismate mutase [Candidatus Neomarinimicrobiota bacterium]